MIHARSPRAARTLLHASLLGAVLTVSGCGLLGHGDLAAQQAAQAELEDISSRYTRLMARVGINEGPIQVADGIDGLVREIGAIQGFSSAQQESASALGAAMQASAGELRSAALMQLAVDQSMLRERIAEHAAAAMILAAGAEPRRNADFAEPSDLVMQMQAGVQMQQESVESGIASLEPRLESMRQSRERSNQQLGSLESDAADLRQRANDAGPVDGYALVEEAAGLRSRAIPVKKTIAETEIELAFLELDSERMLLKRSNLDATREATERAEETTRRLRDAVQTAGAAGRERAQGMLSELKAGLAGYEQRQNDTIAPLFDQAISNLQKAQRGGRGSRGAASTIAANAARSLGDLHAMRADEAMANAGLFDTLAAAGPLGLDDGTDWAKRAEAAREQHATSVEAARTAYQSALEKLGTGRENQPAREAVEALISALDGNSIAPSEPLVLRSAPRPRPGRGNRPAGGAGGGLAAAMGTMGYDSPQALADFMNGLAGQAPNPATLRKVIGACWTEDPEVLASMNDPRSTGQQIGMMSSMNLKVGSVTGNRGELEPAAMPAGMPMKITVPIIKRDGKWFIDIDALAAQMESMMEAAFEGMMMDEGSMNGAGGGGFGRGGGGGRSRN